MRRFVSFYLTITLCLAAAVSSTAIDDAPADYTSLGRPCKVNHCDKEHVCVHRVDDEQQRHCVPKAFFKHNPEKIAEWQLDVSIMNDIIDPSNCTACLSEPFDYVCGSDGRVYRSPCYVDYFNCILERNVKIACNKECPCDEEETTSLNAPKIDSDDPLAETSADDVRGNFNTCSREQHRNLRSRFFDWFHQIEQLEHKIQFMNAATMGEKCTNSTVIYMFHHFDLNNDTQLSDEELESIEHLRDETCTQVFFERCDRDGDHRLFPDEWCDCFRYARLPCDGFNHDFDVAFWNKSTDGVFRPQCTENGYYAARQCNAKTPRECWCVDKHGNELEGTRGDEDHTPQCQEEEGEQSKLNNIRLVQELVESP